MLARFGDELRVAYRLTLQRFLSLQLHGSGDGTGARRSPRCASTCRAAASRRPRC